MKIQLFNPPSHHYTGMQYQMNPALGLPILAAVLNAAGHTCEVTDLEALGVSPDRLQARFAAQRDRWPDVVGVTALTSSARGARDVVRAIRAAGYTGKVIVGGVHATLFEHEPKEWSGVDAVVTGECEGNILHILEKEMEWENGAYRIWHGERAPIESVPAPDWEHHSPTPASYQGNFPKVGHPEGISQWSRGCPWHCVFCGNIVFGHRPTRYRPPANVEAELIALKALGLKALFVYDDELIGGPMPNGWMAEVADRIAPLDFAWKGQGRCSTRHITLDLLADVKRSGCRVMMWGVESFSPNVLRATRKGTSPADIWHTLRASKEAGVQNWLFTMVGNLEETEDDLALTAECLRTAYLEGLVDYRQTTVVTALPGTELWDIQKRDGWWTAPPESGPAMHQVYQPTPWLSAERIAYWLRKFEEACPVSYYGRAACT